MKIYAQKNGTLNEADRLEMARLLIKAGYAVQTGKEPIPGKKSCIFYVEFKEGIE